jgi:hypothetical protein
MSASTTLLSPSASQALSAPARRWPPALPAPLGGNAFRLVVRIEYARQEVYIRAVLTHAEYGREAWKHDPWF